MLTWWASLQQANLRQVSLSCIPCELFPLPTSPTPPPPPPPDLPNLPPPPPPVFRMALKSSQKWRTYWAVDTSGCGHIGMWTHEVDTSLAIQYNCLFYAVLGCVLPLQEEALRLRPPTFCLLLSVSKPFPVARQCHPSNSVLVFQLISRSLSSNRTQLSTFETLMLYHWYLEWLYITATIRHTSSWENRADCLISCVKHNTEWIIGN